MNNLLSESALETINSANLQIFNFGDIQIQIIIINNEPNWVASQITSILGYQNGRKAIADNVDLEDVTNSYPLQTKGGVQNVNLINESGLYSLILKSKLPEAKKFKTWVTKEVLPSIRKNGLYGLPKELTRLELLEIALESEKAKIELEKRVATQQLLISKQNDHNSKLLVMKATQTKTGLKTVKNDIGIEINHLVFKLFPSDTYHNSHKKAHLTYKQDTGLVYVGATKASLESKIDYLNYLRSKDGNNMIISC